MSSIGRKFTGSFEFYRIRERLLEPFPLSCLRGRGTKMSRITFNRKRVKLKKLLGIRARLALLALILVAPLMLERARSLEDTRAKQIAQATQEFSEHRPAQRRSPARSDLLGRDDVEIGGLYPRLGRRRRPQLRHHACQPAGQPALDPQHVDRRQQRPGAMLDTTTVSSASISATATISRRRRRAARLRVQRLSVCQSRTTSRS